MQILEVTESKYSERKDSMKNSQRDFKYKWVKLMTDSTIIKSHKFIDGVRRLDIELLQGEIWEEKTTEVTKKFIPEEKMSENGKVLLADLKYGIRQ